MPPYLLVKGEFWINSEAPLQLQLVSYLTTTIVSC